MTHCWPWRLAHVTCSCWLLRITRFHIPVLTFQLVPFDGWTSLPRRRLHPSCLTLDKFAAQIIWSHFRLRGQTLAYSSLHIHSTIGTEKKPTQILQIVQLSLCKFNLRFCLLRWQSDWNWLTRGDGPRRSVRTLIKEALVWKTNQMHTSCGWIGNYTATTRQRHCLLSEVRLLIRMHRQSFSSQGKRQSVVAEEWIEIFYTGLRVHLWNILVYVNAPLMFTVIHWLYKKSSTFSCNIFLPL